MKGRLPLPAPEEKQVAQVLIGVREVLGHDLAGAYLHGSAALGGLRRSSDVDILAVSARRTTREEKGQLADLLRGLSWRRAHVPARPVELSIIVASEIRPWRPPARLDFQYGE